MCGRTALTASPEDLQRVFGLAEPPTVDPHYNVPPSQPVHVVRVGGAHRKLELLRWGLVPMWAKDPKLGHKLALARVESVTTTPAFRDAIRRRRCLVVVDAFYEWRQGGRAASPFVVRQADGGPFALAGLWERWVSRDGEVIESCAILTQPARPPVDAVHDRMPLLLAAEHWSAWLDPAVTSLEAIASLLEPKEPALIAREVSTYVNDPRHDDASCFAPAEPTQRMLFE